MRVLFEEGVEEGGCVLAKEKKKSKLFFLQRLKEAQKVLSL